MKTRVLHAISALLKLSSGLLAASPALGFDATNAAWGILGFIASSAAKDFLIALGDFLDDGKINKSFTGIIALCLLCGTLLLGTTGCTVTAEGRKELSPVARAAADRLTNVAINLATTYAEAKMRESLESPAGLRADSRSGK